MNSKDGEYPNRDGNLDSQQPVIEDSFSKYSPGNKQKTAKSSKWSLSQFLHARKYSKQEDVPAMEQTEMEMKIIPGSPTLQLNGLPLGKVNPLADYHQDVDNLSVMMKGSMMSMSNEADSWWSKRRKILAHFSSEYMYLAGCHGLARGMQKNGSWPRRLLWFAIAFAAMAVMLYQCTLLIQQFRRNEIQVDVDFSFNRQLAFPAVTFCNLNPLKLSTLTCSRFDTGCDNSTDQQGSDQNDTLLVDIGDALSNTAPPLNTSQLDFSGQPISSQEYLQYGFIPEDMLISCTWNGQSCNAMNFTISPNPFYGNCFTLNGNAKKPLFTNHPGPTSGLILELFVDPYEGVGGETSSSSGVRMSLHQPGVKPFPEEDGFSLSTGFATSIGVRQLEVSRLGSPYSNCTSQDADWQSLYPGYSYSRTACVQSCLAQAMFDTCGCVETFLVGKPICLNAKVNKAQADCVGRVQEDYRLDRLNCDSCYNPCIDRIFLSTLSLSSWPAADYQYHFSRKLVAQNITAQYAAPEVFREYFLRAEIYFEELNYQQIIQKPSYPLENLLADIGGQLGLWAGLSVLGFLELFDFIGQFFLVLTGLKKVKVQ